MAKSLLREETHLPLRQGVFKGRAGDPSFAIVTLLQEATMNVLVSSHRSTQSAFFMKVLPWDISLPALKGFILHSLPWKVSCCYD